MRHIVDKARPGYAEARRRGLMARVIARRLGNKQVELEDGRVVTEFVSCSYLALDEHPAVLRLAKKTLDDFGAHFCCARTRLTIAPLVELEKRLGEFFGGHPICFPSVTSAHAAVLPLLASGSLDEDGRPVTFLFDHQAHASMQMQIPTLKQTAEVVDLPHNDVTAFANATRVAVENERRPVLVLDSVYSMGGAAPVAALLDVTREHRGLMYVDDAHGTSIFGPRGEGFLRDLLGGPAGPEVIYTFSLAKGFGQNGGGVVVPTAEMEWVIRSFGTTYAFSAPLDFAASGGALAALDLHLDGSVARLQQVLRDNVARFDGALGIRETFSPIRMVRARNLESLLDAATALMDAGIMATAAQYPVVPRQTPQLRFAVCVNHSAQQLDHATATLRRLMDQGLLLAP